MARTQPHLDLPDLNGTRAVVTGGSDGFGAVIATELAGAGADVILPVRNTGKGNAVAARIREQHPDAQVSLQHLDLSSLESVRAFGETMQDLGDPIHVLINNAGLMTPPEREETTDGFELQFGTNHLGHFALVGHLLPLLRAGRARVVSQTSIAASRGGINWADPNWTQSYHGMRAYRQSKIAVGLFGIALQQHSTAGNWGITSVLAHPGVAPTGLLAARPEMGRERDTISARLLRAAGRRGFLVGTPHSGALPALLAATSPDVETGRVYGPSGPGHMGGGPGLQDLPRTMRSPEDAERLWQLSEDLTDVLFPGPAL